MSEEKKEVIKTAKELKQEFLEKRAKEIQEITQELNEWMNERHVDIGSRTITEDGGRTRNEVFIIDKL